ncbi:hypothetical protein EMCRGX_G000445 [Ephydatia muelleri]|eukprot:Em0001g325a
MTCSICCDVSTLRHVQHHLCHVQDEAEMADDEDEVEEDDEIEDEEIEDEMGEIEDEAVEDEDILLRTTIPPIKLILSGMAISIAVTRNYRKHCATAFSMRSCAESAYQPYADEYVHMQKSAYGHFNDVLICIWLYADSAQLRILNAVAQ